MYLLFRLQKYLMFLLFPLPDRVIGYCYAQQLPERVIMQNYTILDNVDKRELYLPDLHISGQSLRIDSILIPPN